MFTILISQNGQILELYLISTNYGKVCLPVKSVNGNIGRGVKENYLLTKEKKLINICIDWKVETNEYIRSLNGYGYMISYDKWQKGITDIKSKKNCMDGHPPHTNERLANSNF